MNKKALLACGVALLLLIIAVIVGLKISNKKKNQTVLDSDYPITYEMKKNGSMSLKLNGKKTKDLQWTMEVEDQNVVSVVQKGKESGGKAKYVISPVAEGLSGVTFKRSSEINGYSYNAVTIRLPIYVADENGKLKINLLENPVVSMGPIACAKDSDYPFLVGLSEEGEPDVTFVNGISDWTFADPNNILQSATTVDSEGKTHLIMSQTDPKTGIIKETTVTLSSASLGLTEELDITIDVNGKFSISESE
jgi:hypothetical protein